MSISDPSRNTTSQQMTLRQAYLRLGLAPGATPSEIHKQYLRLAKLAHPDTAGGSDDLMAALAIAYAMVREHAAASSTGTATGTALERRDRSALDRWGGQLPVPRDLGSNRLLTEVTRHRTSSLVVARRQGKLAALTSAGIGAVVALTKTFGIDRFEYSSYGETDTVEWLPNNVRISIVGACAAATALLGFMAWRASARVHWMENALEDVGDTLDDKNALVQILAEVDEAVGLGADWTTDELIDGISAWCDTPVGALPELPRGLWIRTLRSLVLPLHSHDEPSLRDLARLTGPKDFARLVIAKGGEQGLLAEHSARRGLSMEFRYSLVF
jgi:hypothetical protein